MMYYAGLVGDYFCCCNEALCFGLLFLVDFEKMISNFCYWPDEQWPGLWRGYIHIFLQARWMGLRYGMLPQLLPVLQDSAACGGVATFAA